MCKHRIIQMFFDGKAMVDHYYCLKLDKPIGKCNRGGRLRQSAGAVSGGRIRKTMMNQGLYSSERGDWETPRDLFDRVNAEYHFTLDAAANEVNAKCKNYYSIHENGLIQPWEGVVWCNPPYGRQIGRWVEKAYLSWRGGAKVVMLLPARTDTKWFHEWIRPYARIEFLRGRVKFVGAEHNAPFPSMLVYFE